LRSAESELNRQSTLNEMTSGINGYSRGGDADVAE